MENVFVSFYSSIFGWAMIVSICNAIISYHLEWNGAMSSYHNINIDKKNIVCVFFCLLNWATMLGQIQNEKEQSEMVGNVRHAAIIIIAMRYENYYGPNSA